MDIAARSLKIKRTVITKLMDAGLYPYTKHYLGTFDNHFSTIGLIGMNEVGLNAKWLRKDLTHPETQAFAKDVLNHMRERLTDYQEQYGDLYNLEATPAESTTYRLAKHDVEQYPDIITAAKDHGDTPYYTNSSHLPVGYTDDIFDALDIQDELQTLYTSGTVFHAFLGEKLPDWKAAANLVRKIAENYQAALLHHVPHLFHLPRPRLSRRASSITCPNCGEDLRGVQPHHRLLPPCPELERRQGPGVQGPAGATTMWRTPGWRAAACATGMLRRSTAAGTAAQHTGGSGARTALFLFTTKTCPNCKHRQAGAGEGGHRLSGDGRQRASGAGGPVRYPAGPHPDRPPRRAGGEAGERLHHQKIRHFAERVNNEKGGTLVPPFPSSKMPSLRSSTRGTAVTMRGAAKSPLSSVSHQRWNIYGPVLSTSLSWAAARPGSPPPSTPAGQAKVRSAAGTGELRRADRLLPQGGKLSGPARRVRR